MRFQFVALAAAVILSPLVAVAQDFDPMMMADSDQNGKVTLEEFSAFSEMGWGFFSGGVEKIKVADADPMVKASIAGVTPDAEGFVTHEAYTASTPVRFKKADKDGDAALDAAELKASMNPAG